MGRATGLFIEKNGKNYIATNRRVTENASSVKIKFNDENTYDVNGYVALNSEWDLTLLDVDLPSSRILTPFKIISHYPTEGDEIITIGNPLGVLNQSVSTGIVASVRSIPDYGNII